MKLGVRVKLLLLPLGLTAISAIIADAYLERTLEKFLVERIRRDLLVRLELVEREATSMTASLDDRSAWDRFADDFARRSLTGVTIVRADGRVLGDSALDEERLAAEDDRTDRSEIREALAHGFGGSTRYSPIAKQRVMYLAVPFRRDNVAVGVARLSLPLSEEEQVITQLRGILLFAWIIMLASAALLSGAGAAWASRRIRSLTETAERMTGGDLSARARITGKDELAELGRTLDQLAERLAITLQELRADRDLAGSILTNMQEGILLVDSGERLALVNPSLMRALGLGADAVGKTAAQAIRHIELQDLLDHVRSSKTPRSREIEIPSTPPRRLLVSAVPISGEQGSTLAVSVDVTELRRLETLRRDFVANVSHELRTPITAIRSAAETLQGGAIREREVAAGFVEIIERNSTRLEQLVEELLDLARIESGQFRLDIEPLAPAPVVLEVLSLFEERACSKNIRMRSTLPADGERVLADRRALEHVLGNLIDNALKYCSDAAEVRITANVEADLFRVSVEDTGPGIDPSHVPRIFERFYRVDEGRSQDLGGTGLGLSIVKHLVEAMRGTTGVESAPGQGSTFWFTLPRAGAPSV